MELRQAITYGSIYSAGVGGASITPSCLQWRHPLYFFRHLRWRKIRPQWGILQAARMVFPDVPRSMTAAVHIRVDRSARITLAEQIRRNILAAISSGALAPGARLSSWIALAAQLGVARGTVKSAYERLADEQVVVSSR
ncbi:MULTISPECIES: GntR family transcriptional regulator [Rhodanobacter]|uniref:GntR family transcriptional regulator n=1 Tax=Rhodanobacter TaxID=75309 RepID=UPI0003F588DD|nr:MULTISPECIES: winged helix-turn-helix domain-containing protein [Rhodanobacter]UJJ53783.1 winged helix-turn-helix domain-containing protein [Rhodanobacter thiooxydans]